MSRAPHRESRTSSTAPLPQPPRASVPVDSIEVVAREKGVSIEGPKGCGAEAERLSLIDTLDGEFIKLPLQVMREVGPAVQTLGGVLQITSRETFVKRQTISEAARVPVGTVDNHLPTLHAGGWIVNKGRQHTRRGRPRRTATIAVTKKTRDDASPYAILPWWAACHVQRVGRLSWSARAVLSVIMSRLAALKAAFDRNDFAGSGDADFEQTIADEWSDRFTWSLRQLTESTGLSRQSVVKGTHELHRLNIVQWTGDTRDDGGDDTDHLRPNPSFRVVVTPAGPGRCKIGFEMGS